MGDPAAKSGTGLSSDVINTVMQNLPQYMNLVNSQLKPQAESELAASQATSPGYQKLLTKLYEQYAPRLAEAGSKAEAVSRKGTAATDVELLQGAGGQAARESQVLDKTLNPEYYKTRAAEASKLGDLLGSINLNNANPEAERLISQENARSGNASVPSATGTVSNALSFGNELQKRRDALGSAINIASNFLQPSSGSFNSTNIALGKGPTGTGLSEFGGINRTQNQAIGVGNSLTGTTAGLVGQQQDINAQRRDLLDRLNETTTGIGSLVSV